MKVKENYSEFVGVRVTPTTLKRLATAAKKNNMSTALFVRWVLLNHLDALGF